MKTITRAIMLFVGLLWYDICQAQLGCTDENAENFDSTATEDDGSCSYATCIPLLLELEEDCIWDTNSGEFVTRVIVTPTISGICFLQEICYQEVGGGTQGCLNLPALDLFIQSGESVIIPLLGSGVYEFTASTNEGTSDATSVEVNCYDNESTCGNPYAVNYDAEAIVSFEPACIYDNYICDCAGTQHNIGVLLWLGDGFYEEGTGTSVWYGQAVDFSCNLWGWDCGDGGIIHDPYDTCEGALPPNNGCAAPTCSPLTMTFSQAECTYTDASGFKPAFYAHFAMNGTCAIEEFVFRESSTSPWVTIPLFNEDQPLVSGDSLLLTNTVAEATYQCYFRSVSGAVSPYFYFTNGSCESETTFCDCAFNVWSTADLAFLGNGEENAGFTGEGVGINFNCLTWGYDCGDLGVEGDPVGVCNGNLPPDNGCSVLIFGCSDEVACNFNESVNFDDGTCDYESCLGCMNPVACNFDVNATQDNATCEFESCLGCIDVNACNFNLEATQDNGSCSYDCIGCYNPFACNFNEEATIDDGSCDFSCFGCTDENACNFNAVASVDDGSCSTDCLGCMDDAACNYDPFALLDNGLCDYNSCAGCTDPGACNFDSSATISVDNCTYACFGCTDPYACNFALAASINDGSCDYTCMGCTDPEACNFSELATINNGSCDFTCFGCTDPDACNYNPFALVDDGSCAEDCVGCTDLTACNYDPFAEANDGSCDFISCQGCVIPAACNYDPEALLSDGSCDFSCYGCTDPEACNYSAEYLFDSGGCEFISCAGCQDEGACNYDPSATISADICEYITCVGCTDATAFNYDPFALINDENCIYECQTPLIDWQVSACNEGLLTIEMNVTNLGNAPPWNLVNNIESGAIEINEVGMYSIGPFEASDIVVGTLISQTFGTCITNSPTLSCPTNVEEKQRTSLLLYPNPAQTQFTLQFSKSMSGEVTVISANGALVTTKMVRNQVQIELDSTNWAEGIYSVIIRSEGEIQRKSLLVTH